MQQASRYRGHVIQVIVSDTNTVRVRVYAPQSGAGRVRAGDGRILYDQGVESRYAKPRSAGLIQQAWTIGREFVDTRLELEEALRFVPEWGSK